MSHRRATLLLPTLLALGLLARDGAAQVSGTPAQPAARTTVKPVDAAAEEQAIRTLSQRWLAAHRKRDANTVMTNYTDDAVAVYGGTRVVGRDAIRKFWEDGYAQAARERPDYMPSWQTLSVRVAEAGDMAYETGRYEDTWNSGKNHERGYYVTNWRKVGGQWKVANDMSVAVPDSTPPR